MLCSDGAMFTGQLWVYHGYTMGIPWVYYVIPYIWNIYLKWIEDNRSIRRARSNRSFGTLLQEWDKGMLQATPSFSLAMVSIAALGHRPWSIFRNHTGNASQFGPEKGGWFYRLGMDEHPFASQTLLREPDFEGFDQYPLFKLIDPSNVPYWEVGLILLPSHSDSR